MNNNIIYAVFSGAYSDWNVHGYFDTRDEAEKYCAMQNKDIGWSYDEYYVEDLKKINANVSDIRLNYYHEVMFDFNTGMRNEPDRYKYYQGNDKAPITRYNVFSSGDGWISFSFNCQLREKAEKIAQDKYATFIYWYNETGSYHEAAKVVGAVHI